MLLKKDLNLVSPISVLFYEAYHTIDAIQERLQANKIQCIVASPQLDIAHTVNFGQAQIPALTDYADGVDTLEFLTHL